MAKFEEIDIFLNIVGNLWSVPIRVLELYALEFHNWRFLNLLFLQIWPLDFKMSRGGQV